MAVLSNRNICLLPLSIVLIAPNINTVKLPENLDKDLPKMPTYWDNTKQKETSKARWTL